jgi:predicted deacylase
LYKIIFYALFSLQILNASYFHLIKKDSQVEAPTLLIVGGIHGNEPGGFFAPAILAQYYRATKGSFWIVPNLNQPSIQAQSRGINGDMNRKFAPDSPKDGDSKNN